MTEVDSKDVGDIDKLLFYFTTLFNYICLNRFEIIHGIHRSRSRLFMVVHFLAVFAILLSSRGLDHMDLELHMHSVPITTKFMSSNPAQASFTRCNIM